MKRFFLYSALGCALLAFNACRNDTKEMLQTIDGQWNVKSIKFIDKTNRDSTVATSQVFLNFESCSKSSNGQSPGNCAMQYRVGSTNYNFTYQANGKESIYFSPVGSNDPTYRQVADVISGSYEIMTFAPTSLVLRKRISCTTTTPEACDYLQLTASK